MKHSELIHKTVMGGLVLGLCCGLSGFAQGMEAKSGQKRKCEVYAKTWVWAQQSRGRDGLSQDFVDENEIYLKGNCMSGAIVCPRSPKDIEIANLLTIATMNAGAASTFVPFHCKPLTPAPQ